MKESNSSTRRGNETLRIAGVLAAALCIAIASGCATPRVVEEESQTVSKAHARRDLGIDYLSSHKTAMAIRELRASLQEDPSDPRTHLWLGEAYRRKRENEQARKAFEKAATLAAEQEDIQVEQDARLNLSGLLSQMGRHAEAIPHCEALATDPTFTSPWRPLSNCAWARIQLGRFDEARANLEQALEFFPRFGPALLNLGILEAKQGHNLAAAVALDKAIASGRLNGSGRTEANFRLGEIFVALGDREKAVAHFRAAVEMGPTLEWGSQSQAYLDLLH